ncbi:phosphotransferase [Pedococcus sp. 2YAF34]|uniref:phosphotransferase n=1 Tax=Pedococcus sp. 2YAF34 TaxID=3233032 RepID=UPI003F9983D3
MERTPLFLAALASAAVPGLDPASVEALPGTPDHQYDVAFVQDTQHRRWVIRVPRSQAAAAQMESTFGLLGLLARRLPFSVPTPKGFAPLKEGGRAAIYPFLPGQNIDFSALPPGPGLAAELGRAIAALHNADHGLFEEAGLPAYDADTYRTRRLTELDRAAATGHVPTGLLARWEKQLEDVALWRFAPTPTHGDLTGDQVLVVFEDDQDASTGRVKAFTGWEDAKVADPADDFSALATQASEPALETLMEAYAHARSERPDPHLLTRARLVAEMRVLSALLAAVGSADRLLVERHAAALRRLEDEVHEREEAAHDYRRAGTTPARRPGPVVVPPDVVEDTEDEEDEDVAVMFAPTVNEDEAADYLDQAADEDERRDDGDESPADPEDHEDEREQEEPEGQEHLLHDPAQDDHDEQPVPEPYDDSTTEIPVASPPAAPRPPASAAPVQFDDDDEDPGPEFEPGYSRP